MSRLQVGGLALVIGSKYEENVGRVVRLIEYRGLLKSPFDGKEYDYWKVKYDSPVLGKNRLGLELNGEIIHTASKNLMPLGDKQTQDELLRESKLDNV